MNGTKRSAVARRVVITGIGAVSPNGIGTDAFCAALRGGISGVSRITLFDAEAFECQVAAEVKNHQPENFLPARELRRA